LEGFYPEVFQTNEMKKVSNDYNRLKYDINVLDNDEKIRRIQKNRKLSKEVNNNLINIEVKNSNLNINHEDENKSKKVFKKLRKKDYENDCEHEVINNNSNKNHISQINNNDRKYSN